MAERLKPGAGNLHASAEADDWEFPALCHSPKGRAAQPEPMTGFRKGEEVRRLLEGAHVLRTVSTRDGRDPFVISTICNL
jgi:hypothetical protein